MSDLEEEYQLEYFHEEGFVRRECPSCGDHFWTRDADRGLWPCLRRLAPRAVGPVRDPARHRLTGRLSRN